MASIWDYIKQAGNMAGEGLSDAASLAGRGFWGAATLGATEIGRAQERAQQEGYRDIGSILAGEQIPNFLRPGQTPESMSPEQFDQKKLRQLYYKGTPEAVGIANKFLETPEIQLQREKTKADIAAQKESLNLQRQNIINDKSYKDKTYNLAVKELESKLKLGDPKEIFDRETKLRGEFTTQAKDYISQRDAYSRILASAKDPSAAGDIALIYNFMKVQDPNSTVREGEFATAQNAGGVPEATRAKWNKLLTGERLDPKVRADFVDRSQKLFGTSQEQHDKRVAQYKGLAERSGVNPDQVILDLGLAETAPQMTPIKNNIKFLGFE